LLLLSLGPRRSYHRSRINDNARTTIVAVKLRAHRFDIVCSRKHAGVKYARLPRKSSSNVYQYSIVIYHCDSEKCTRKRISRLVELKVENSSLKKQKITPFLFQVLEVSFHPAKPVMSKVSFSTLAYCKMVAHAAKYPHCEVNGLLIAENATKGDKLVIVDTVPLFHQCLHVSPMSEIALMQTDQSASTCDMYIAGYYLANETLDDLR